MEKTVKKTRRLTPCLDLKRGDFQMLSNFKCRLQFSLKIAFRNAVNLRVQIFVSDFMGLKYEKKNLPGVGPCLFCPLAGG
jgi:hypothetical protein